MYPNLKPRSAVLIEDNSKEIELPHNLNNRQLIDISKFEANKSYQTIEKNNETFQSLLPWTQTTIQNPFHNDTPALDNKLKMKKERIEA